MRVRQSRRLLGQHLRSLLLGASLVAVPALAEAPRPPLPSGPDSAQAWLQSLIVQAADAQQAGQRSSGQPATPPPFEHLRAAVVENVFNRLDFDRNEHLDATDLTSRIAIETAQRRAAFLSSKLAFDLDGDGRVTRDELSAALRARAQIVNPVQSAQTSPLATAERLRLMVETELKLDADGDGALSLVELIAAFQAVDAPRAATNPIKRLHDFAMTADANRDGQVTREEVGVAARAAFAALDADGDGALSAQEVAAVRQQLRVPNPPQIPPAAPLPVACNLPKVSAGAKLALVGIYEGKALSTVRLGSADTRETTVADVFIEKGDEPLVVVLTSYRPNIWRFTGAVDRVVQVIAGAQQGDQPQRSHATGIGAPPAAASPPSATPLVGVMGLPKERVHIAARPNCLPMFYDRTKSAAQIKQIGDALGRAPDVVAGTYGATTIQLPSGIDDRGSTMPGAVKAPDHPDAIKVWQEMLRFNPAGLLEIDPAKVVAAGTVARYGVLPNQAGLAQLVADGAMVLEPGGFGPSMTLTIKKPMHFPAALHGAHSVTFILAKGVSMPEGDAGHSCVFSEETGQPIGKMAGHCKDRTPRRLAALANPPALGPAKTGTPTIRDCQTAFTAPVQFCAVVPEELRPGSHDIHRPMPINMQYVDTRGGEKRLVVPDGTYMTLPTYSGRHGIVVGIAKTPPATGAPMRLKVTLIKLDGTLAKLPVPEMEEVYSAMPAEDDLLVYARTGTEFALHRINLVRQTLVRSQPATREQADAGGHRLDPPLGRSDRMDPSKTFPSYKGREMQASCLGVHGCLRQFLENDTDGDGRLSPADRKRLAYSSFDGKRNELLPFEVDEVLGEKTYLDGIEVIVRTGTRTHAFFFDHNVLKVVSEREAIPAEAVNGRRR